PGVQSVAVGTSGAGRRPEKRPVFPENPRGEVTRRMLPSTRAWLTLCLLLTAAPAALRAQAPAAPPKPLTKQELDRRHAVELYAVGLVRQGDSRLVEAIGTFEKALRPAPESARLRKALVPLSLAVDRTEDALSACQQILEIEPGDHETWSLYARQLKLLG